MRCPHRRHTQYFPHPTNECKLNSAHLPNQSSGPGIAYHYL